MTPQQTRQWLALLLLCALACPEEARRPPYLRPGAPDFSCSRILPDGEVERRLHRGRLSAIETTVELSSPNGLVHEFQILTWLQVSEGRHFIQLIYDSTSELRDCEYLKSPEAVERFYQAFSVDKDCPSSHSSRNFTSRILPDNFTDSYVTLKRECQALHKRVRESMAHHEHHKDWSKVEGFQHRRPASEELQRLRRDLFLYPGTNWCGSGSNARKFNELGYNAAADRCCRDHDHCPFTIEGFTSSFNFFNFRFHTISHCDCDERFRACLKLSSTGAGNMVGKLFFNVVQTKCFLFKHVKKCGKRSWWGKCLKFEKEKTAILRDALKY